MARKMSLSIIGFGVVGRGLAELLLTQRDLLKQRYDVEIALVSVATARHGFIYRESGLDIATLLTLAAQKRSLTEHPDVAHWPDALEGLWATGGDILAEVTGTNLRDGEPGIQHIRAALQHGMHVVTANKGPIALAGRDLMALARSRGLQLRVESTVMAGTPVMSTLLEGLAGTRVRAVRGILNGTTNYILSAMSEGRDYAEVLAEAQERGYAEADPTADVEGYDAAAKALILAALVFDRSLSLDQIVRRGIADITREEVEQAQAEGKRIKLITSLQLVGDGKDAALEARVEPVALPLHDPLARVDGVTNAITCTADAPGDVTIIGPGAGGLQTGQGLLADIITIASR
jgi:homoserine dehydrogenase